VVSRVSAFLTRLALGLGGRGRRAAKVLALLPAEVAVVELPLRAGAAVTARLGCDAPILLSVNSLWVSRMISAVQKDLLPKQDAWCTGKRAS
jgi:hypothetical protein